MEILLTGNTCFVTPAWVEMAFPEDHVLITCARGQPHPPRIRTITLDSKERIGQLVDSYEFDRIVYFSEYQSSTAGGGLSPSGWIVGSSRHPGSDTGH